MASHCSSVYKMRIWCFLGIFYAFDSIYINRLRVYMRNAFILVTLLWFSSTFKLDSSFLFLIHQIENKSKPFNQGKHSISDWNLECICVLFYMGEWTHIESDSINWTYTILSCLTCCKSNVLLCVHIFI